MCSFQKLLNFPGIHFFTQIIRWYLEVCFKKHSTLILVIIYLECQKYSNINLPFIRTMVCFNIQWLLKLHNFGYLENSDLNFIDLVRKWIDGFFICLGYQVVILSNNYVMFFWYLRLWITWDMSIVFFVKSSDS